jgi:hypothetical protein
MNLKFKGVPLTLQLRPITLINTGYKLLTKVYMNRLLHILPAILKEVQLCSV